MSDIYTSSKHIQVWKNSQTFSVTGAVQYNGSIGQFEVSTGTGWTKIERAYSIALGDKAEIAIDWAVRKMEEEQKLAELRNKFPAIDQAAQEVERAQRDLDAVITLCGGTK